MKSYLDLVPISAKVHRKQDCMSIICIVLAVFLVTAIFGMADMFIRGQILQAQQENGNWHIGIRNISDEDAKLIASRSEVAAAADYGVFNYRGGKGYTLSGKNVTVCGSNESAVAEIFAALDKGSFPANGDEALVTNNAKNMLHLEIGEQIVITMPDGSGISYTISGFMNNTVRIMSKDSYGVCLTTESFRAIYPDGTNSNPADYTMRLLKFKSTRNIQGNIAEIKQQFGLSDEQVSENTELLGLLGQSSNSFMLQVYAVAVILFILVLIAGVLMITSSMNSNVAQRTEFFGMVRCIICTNLITLP